MRFVKLVVWLFCAATSEATAGNLPSLSNTNLLTKYAVACKPVDLTSWVHPTKLVLAKFRVPISRLDLCNSGKFPIFYVIFQYDPMLNQTDSFFLPFYKAMWKANGRNPMGFVVTSSNETIELVNSGAQQPQDLHEQYAE